MTAPALTPTRQAVARHHAERARLARFAELEAENKTLRAQNAKLTKTLDAARAVIATTPQLEADVERLRKAVEREPVWATVLPITTIRFIFGWQA